ncbi:hypothetical protein K7B10_32090 [Streptomyces flavotricini]|uniref:Uncharacterized protein n=1 Tax=Streptomyces flavotricini TaxID=66888 RepID=A0ABS8EE57_9ACTN|nr:hypothetical protein [Streptomyces flavotricini]MCC0099333.1 hypothetical protein [Streptomyces flavotricini]
MSPARAREPAHAARPGRMIQHSGKGRGGGVNPPATATTAHHERQYP